MIGERIRLTAYDGYADYIVAEDNGRTVVLEHDKTEPYAYTAPLIGDRCEVSRENVQAQLDWQRRMAFPAPRIPRH
jgi:hypothetical protein